MPRGAHRPSAGFAFHQAWGCPGLLLTGALRCGGRGRGGGRRRCPRPLPVAGVGLGPPHNAPDLIARLLSTTADPRPQRSPAAAHRSAGADPTGVDSAFRSLYSGRCCPFRLRNCRESPISGMPRAPTCLDLVARRGQRGPARAAGCIGRPRPIPPRCPVPPRQRGEHARLASRRSAGHRPDPRRQ